MRKSLKRLPTYALAMTLAGSVLAQPDPRWPDALQRAYAAHSSARLRTAIVELAYQQVDVQTGQEGRTEFYSWRCAGDQYVQIFRGDEAGVVIPRGDGPPDELSFREQNFLAEKGRLWAREGGSGAADVTDGRHPLAAMLFDVRLAGADPGCLTCGLERMFEEARRAGIAEFDFDERADGDQRMVTARFGGGEVRWWIDPQRDWLVTRTQALRDGVVIGETSVRLREYDGAWFPQVIERFVARDGELETAGRVETLYAEFNRPEHPQRLSPRDIGVEPGMTVHDSTAGRIGVWDGAQTVPPEEFFERVRRGEARIGPNAARLQARARLRNAQWRSRGWDPLKPGSIGLTTRPVTLYAAIEALLQARWDQYTQDVIRVYRLDDRQREKALEILAASRREARSYLAGRRSEITDWQRDWDELRAAASDAESAARRRAQLNDRRRKLVEPLDAIFEGRLKNGLERLPTADQRRSVEVDGKPPSIDEPRLGPIVGD